MPRIILGISGASGLPLAHAMLIHLSSVTQMEIHLVLSQGAQRVMQTETHYTLADFASYAHTVHAIDNMAAAPSSGSWLHQGMIVCPCSMASLAAIATGVGTHLIHRAADVCLKERRPLVLVPRESPLNRIHLHNMLTVTEAGGIIMPFAPAFYTQDNTLTAMMRHFTGRVLDQFKIPHDLCDRWQSVEKNGLITI